MNANHIIKKIKTLKQNAEFYWPDHIKHYWVNPNSAGKIGAIVIVNCCPKYGNINEYVIHISSNGDFTVERPLYSAHGYLIPTPEIQGPYKTDWIKLMNNWIPTLCPDRLQENRVSKIKHELMMKVWSDYV